VGGTPGKSSRGGIYVKKLVAFATATLTAIVLAAPSFGGGGKHDSAVGGFRGVGGVNNVGFSAHSDPNGANPFGQLSQTIPQGRKDLFTVTCLAVNGNHAAIGLTAADATTAQNFPKGRVLVVIDNGNPAGGQPVDNYGYVSSSSNDCTLFTATVVTNVPESGDISIHDEP
jgi:hypothetical protein